MSEQQLQFKNNNPGAVQYGNFINYYEFNPPSNRINLLPTNLWKILENSQQNTFLALDIGCNAGNLTHELSNFLQNHLPINTNLQILAVDIDKVLIHRAREQYKAENIKFECCDCSTTEFQSIIDTFLENFNRRKFDAIFCFSTTMWIHLNQGDEGLKLFLRNICKFAELFVVEPQPWKCYMSAVKRMKKMLEFPCFNQLEMRHNVVDDIERFIIELGMLKVFESAHTEWKRKIFCFV